MSNIVVLVHPENPRNIGFCARAMKCNGVEELRIVSDRLTSMHGAAYITGTSGKDILDKATFYTSLEDALTDTTTSVAFSRRRFAEADSFIFLPDLKPRIEKASFTALVFGRESKGLFEHEMELCDYLCEIPIATNLSYNLGQAVSIVLYELCLKGLESSPIRQESYPTQGEKKAFLQMIGSSVPRDYLVKGKKAQKFSNFLTRINPDQGELRLLFGLFRELLKGQKNES